MVDIWLLVFVLLVMLVLYFGLLIGCWIDDVAHVCKHLDVLLLEPIACIGWS